MKDLVIILFLVFTGLLINAQEFNLGLSAGTTLGETGERFDSAFILDAEYLHEMSERIKLGATTGYMFYTGTNDYTTASIFGENTTGVIQVENTGFIPLAVALRFKATEKLTFGADLGYAFKARGIASSKYKNNNGFYFALKAQYQIKDYLYLTTSFRTIMLDDNRLPVEYDAREDNFYMNILSFGVLIKL